MSGLYALGFLIYGVTIPAQLGKMLSFIPLLVVAIFAVLDNWLWRKGPILRLVKLPLLDGTWVGILTSIRRDENDKRITSEQEITMVFRQALTSTSVTLMTATSKSRSSTAQFRTPQKDDYLLEYQYSNTPKLEFRDSLTAHVGGSVIEVAGSRPDEIVGEYWTARDTKGTYELHRISNKKASSLKQAREMSREAGGA